MAEGRGRGRPRLRLVELLESGRFDAGNKRHRRVLLEDGEPLVLSGSADWVAGVVRLVGLYRSRPERPYGRGFADQLEALVRDRGRS